MLIPWKQVAFAASTAGDNSYKATARDSRERLSANCMICRGDLVFPAR